MNVVEFHTVMVLSIRNISEQANVTKKVGAFGTGFTYAAVIETGGKPSTWFPPEGLVEIPGFCAVAAAYLLFFNLKNENSKI